MPYIIRPNLIRRLAAGAFGTAVLLGATPPALSAAATGQTASASCPTSVSSALLADYGDKNAYTLLTNGLFESGSTGWTLSGASVVSGAGVKGGLHWLEIKPNGSAVSPQFCVNSEYPSFRFFSHSIGTAHTSQLNVSLRWSGLLGIQMTTSVSAVQSGSSWTLSPVEKLAEALPLSLNGGSLKVSLVFQAPSGSASAVDGIYIDPYSR
jgi:hypothetical protein